MNMTLPHTHTVYPNTRLHVWNWNMFAYIGMASRWGSGGRGYGLHRVVTQQAETIKKANAGSCARDPNSEKIPLQPASEALGLGLCGILRYSATLSDHAITS